MIYTIEIKRVVDFCDLYDLLWSGALDTLGKVEQEEKEDELMRLIDECFNNEAIDLVQLNDFLRFEQDFIFEQLGIKNE